MTQHPVEQRPVQNRTAVGWLLHVAGRLIGILVISAFFSVLVEWVGMSFFYETPGHTHAKSMLEAELKFLGAQAAADTVNRGWVQTGNTEVRQLISFIFVESGLVGVVASARTFEEGDNKLTTHFKRIFAVLYDYLMAMLYILATFLVRLTILILSAPAFLLFGLVGFFDGLAQRDLRRWGGGRESALVYHWAKSLAVPTMFTAWILYLAVPVTIHPNIILMPFAICFGLVLMTMASKFKKYL